MMGSAICPSLHRLLLPSLQGKEGLRSGTVVRVQCVPAYSLLLALNITHIDLFSLDIENAEVPVIQSFPFDKIHVEVSVFLKTLLPHS